MSAAVEVFDNSENSYSKTSSKGSNRSKKDASGEGSSPKSIANSVEDKGVSLFPTTNYLMPPEIDSSSVISQLFRNFSSLSGSGITLTKELPIPSSIKNAGFPN